MNRVLFFIFLIIGLFVGFEGRAQIIIPDDVNSQCQCWCNCQPVNDLSSNEEDDFVAIEAGDVVISEFVSDPITGGKEWIELYNRLEKEIDLSSLFLIEGSGQKTQLTGELLPGEYVVFNKSSLNNSGDIIILQTIDNQVIDQVAYGDWDDGDLFDNAPMAADPYSVIRLSVNRDYDIDFQDFFVTLVPTPGLENIYEPIVVEVEEESELEEEVVAEENEELDNSDAVGGEYVGDVIITEIFANPEGSDVGLEFIEIYNNGQTEVNLKGWKLDDIDGGSGIFVIKDDLFLAPGQYHSFYNNITKLTLNNDTDMARLLTPDDLIIQTIEYKNCVEGQSYNLYKDEWYWSNIVTPGEENEVADLEIAGMSSLVSASSAVALKSSKLPIKTTLDKVRQYDNGQLVSVSGVVSVPPGLLGKNIIYLQGSGIQVYFSKGQWPELAIGDRVELVGKMSEVQGERRINLAQAQDILVIEQGNSVEPHEIKAQEIGEQTEGWLVKVTGEVVAKDGVRLTLLDDTGEVIVYFKSTTALSVKNYNEGDRLTIIGIITQSKDEYRLIPRINKDLISLEIDNSIAGVVEEEKQIWEKEKYGLWQTFLSYGLIFFLLVGVLIWYLEKKYDLRRKIINLIDRFKKKSKSLKSC